MASFRDSHVTGPTPTVPFVDRFMPVLSAFKQVSASHRSECLFTAPISCAWQNLQGVEIGHQLLP